jgi:hypothetical protein
MDVVDADRRALGRIVLQECTISASMPILNSI